MQSLFILRGCWLVSSGVLMLGLAGCIPFEAKFAADRGWHSAEQPLAGSWSGTWTSQSSSADHPARAIIEMKSAASCNLWLELSGYRNLIGNWIAASDVPLDRTADGREHFHIKVPLEAQPKQDVWSVAIEMEGQLDGNSLVIRFRTNDAMRQLDEGVVRLIH